MEKIIEVIDPAPYTMSGLARILEIDRRTLVDYAHRDKYLPTIKAAREKVHENVETRLMEKSAIGAIFNLKNNFGWNDKTEVEQSGKLEVRERTEEELNAIIAKEFDQYVQRRKRQTGVRHNGKKVVKGK